MRYPLTHKTRQSVIVVVLLLAVGALAAAAAHVSRSGAARGDIPLLDPMSDRSAKEIITSDIQASAPLFGAGSVQRFASGSSGVAGAFVPGAAADARRFNLVAENRRGGSSSFRDFVGERSRSGNPRNGSGGSAAFGGGGGSGGGGGWGGVSGTAPGRGNTASSANLAAGSPRTAAPASGARPGGGSGGAPAGEAAALPGATGGVLATGVLATGVLATAPLGSNSPSTSPTPEPLTLLLVGTGLAGLYGARKHLAG